ncbi:MAG: hypothetical protein AAF389_01425 [Gemmatimonadota bacterium]
MKPTDGDIAPRAGALPWLVLAFVVLGGHLSLVPRVADLDGFYHVGHALAYLESGLTDTSLPWATRSIIADYRGDLWWGFHVLMIPFAAIGNVGLAMQAAGFALTALLAAVVGWVLHRHGVQGAGFWAALFLLAVPNIFFRHLMVRPHVVSMAAGILLLSTLAKGRWWHALLLSALMSWVHLNLFWFAPGIAVAYALARIPATTLLGPDQPDEGVPIRYAIPAVIAGTLLGWVLRPEPVQTALLLNVQLVQLFTQKTLAQPLTFAAELSPLDPVTLFRTSWFFWIAWMGSIVYAARSSWAAAVRDGERSRPWRQDQGTVLIAAFAISVVFFALTLGSARRAMEQWVSFGVLGIAVATAPTIAPWARSIFRDRHLTAASGILVVVLLAHLGWGAYRHSLNVTRVAFPASTMAEVSRFLASESEPGEVVFHARWDNFGPLFAHNRSNHYLGGMDPIFQYAHDPRAFWEFFYLSSDVNTEWTCDAYPCPDGIATDTHTALREHFGARWVVVEPRRNPRFSLYLLNDDRYRLALETQREAVFEVLPPATP